MFQTLKSLSPCVPGPWMPYRRYVAEQMKEMGVKPGDIVCRLGNAYLFGFFWMSDFIAKITKSRYSHAAIVTEVDENIIISDVSTNGCRRQFAPEWTDEVLGDDILIVRYEGDPLVPLAAVENVKSVEGMSFSYDDTFSEKDKFYCTELICWSYLRAGVNLCEEVPIKYLPGWKSKYKFFAWMNGVNPETSVWCVGNNEIGILSSKDLVEVGRIKMPSKKENLTSSLPIFTGA